jgi:predicted DCC family thiol-disulfide oxidoreductase YuxK
MSSDAFVYDDDCGFCTWWADFFVQRTDLEAVGFEELTDQQLERLPDDYESCAHLIADGTVYSCGAAIEQSLVRADLPPGSEQLVRFLGQFEDYERLRERLYREVADRRGLWGQFLSKDRPDGSTN